MEQPPSYLVQPPKSVKPLRHWRDPSNGLVHAIGHFPVWASVPGSDKRTFLDSVCNIDLGEARRYRYGTSSAKLLEAYAVTSPVTCLACAAEMDWFWP